MVAKLQPNRVRRSYAGGSRIDAFCRLGANVAAPSAETDGPAAGSSQGAAQPRPEDWLASTVQAFNGTYEIEGEGLGRLEDGRLVKDVFGSLPILVKLLDSDERLTVQAHPSVPCARRLFNSPVGKTESWYFLPGTIPDACVYLGFKPGITRAAWERAVREAIDAPSPRPGVETGVLSLLHRIPVSAGDFVFVEGGVPHAIGAGCFMVELQEPSDLIVVAERFTPSGRRIPDVKINGGVGWDAMFDVYEYEGLSFEETCARYVRHSAGACVCGRGFTDKFAMWKLEGGGRLALRGAPAVVVVTDGSGSLNGVPVRRGDRLVVSGEDTLAADGAVAMVVATKDAAL